MIERIHKLLERWAAEAREGWGGPAQLRCVMGPAAETRPHRRKAQRIERNKQGVIVKLETGEPTALGVASRLVRKSSPGMADDLYFLDAAINRLPREFIEVIQVFYLQGGMAIDERAKRLRVSRKTLYRRLDAAHSALADELEGCCYQKVSST